MVGGWVAEPLAKIQLTSVTTGPAVPGTLSAECQPREMVSSGRQKTDGPTPVNPFKIVFQGKQLLKESTKEDWPNRFIPDKTSFTKLHKIHYK